MESKNIKTRNRLQLIVEKKNAKLWGRVAINGVLIYDYANNLTRLKKKIKDLILEFESIQVNDFEVSYDLTAFFEDHSYLSITDLAKRTGINPGLMRQYSSGSKFPSELRVKQIEEVIRNIGRELSRVKLHKHQADLA